MFTRTRLNITLNVNYLSGYDSLYCWNLILGLASGVFDCNLRPSDYNLHPFITYYDYLLPV